MEFFEIRTIKKSRKPRKCESCGRTIPVGHEVYNCKGKDGGEFFSYYMCTFCETNSLGAGDEFIEAPDTFNEYIENHSISKCPNCKTWASWGNWDWSTDNTSIIFKCNDCGYEWEMKIEI